MPPYTERRSDIEGITFFRLDELKIQSYRSQRSQFYLQSSWVVVYLIFLLILIVKSDLHGTNLMREAASTVYIIRI